MNDYQDALVAFKLAQERLKRFIEEHMEYTIDGLDFVNERGREQLDREYCVLKKELDSAGTEWALALSKTPVEARQ
jgi:hypothetical protein